MTRSGFVQPLAALLLLALGSGCGKVRAISNCRGLAREVNAALDEIEPLSKQVPVDELRIANRYAALAKTLEPRGVGDKPLALAVRDYIAIMHATEASLRNHDALQRAPYLKMADSRRELERLVKRQHSATLRIQTECH